MHCNVLAKPCRCKKKKKKEKKDCGKKFITINVYFGASSEVKVFSLPDYITYSEKITLNRKVPYFVINIKPECRCLH